VISTPLFSLRTSLRARAWIALVAMLALALLPVLSQAVGPHTPGRATLAPDICSVQPAAAPADGVDQSEPGSPAHAAAHLQHCAACLISVDAVGLPPSPWPALPAAAVAQAPPWRADTRLRSQPARCGHQPRAPPERS
jgi:hypothetical protein